MDRTNIYYRQVQLLVRVLPIIAKENCFALKGGTGINLFVRDLPRLSVDIDLVYLPLDERTEALANVRSALSRIAQDIERAIHGSKIIPAHEETDVLRLHVRQGDARVKIELSPVLRGSVFSPVLMRVRPRVEEEFGYAEMPVLAFPDLYAGKLCAALDRQHPRDLFDVKQLLENEGITEELRKTFLVYLISHNRPIAELILPVKKDIQSTFKSEFMNMTTNHVSVEELEEAREKLIDLLQKSLTKLEKKFLLSFKSLEPDWKLLGLENVEELPAVRWKIINLRRMPVEKHAAAFEQLRRKLQSED